MASTSIAATRPGPHLPTALVVGPQKTGTTWLQSYLEWRGDVGLPRKVKETWFFDRYWDRGVEWYEAHFDPDPAHEVIVEISPGYFDCPDAPWRVLRTLGRVPIVCLLRDPVERTVSLWIHMRRYGMTRLGFREAARRIPSLYESGRYGTHVERWQESFGDRLLVLFQPELFARPEASLGAFCRHVGLPPRVPPAEVLARRANEAAAPPSHTLARLGWQAAIALRSAGLHDVVERAKKAGLKDMFFGAPGDRELPHATDAEKAELRDTFIPEIEKLERLLGVDLARWKSAPLA